MLKLRTSTFLGNNTFSFNAAGIVISETIYREKVFEGWHCHENNHITFIVKGGNREQRRCGEQEALPGHVLVYHSGETHRNVNTQHPSRNINLEIEDAFLLRHGLSFQVQLNDPALRPALVRIWRECCMNDSCSTPSVQAAVLWLLGSAATSSSSGSIPPWAGRLRGLLDGWWGETFSLQQLANALHVHPVTISKHFPRYFSCTLGEYMRRIKVDKALCLMRQPGRPLTGIAYECGFFDQSHFTRTFQACTGMLPGGYQKL